MSIAYLSTISTVEITTNPDNSDYSSIFQVSFEFPIEDFLLVDEDKAIAVGRMGRLCFSSFKGNNAGQDHIDFQLDLEDKEMVTCMAMCSTSRYLAIATQKMGKLKRIFLYERQFDTVLIHQSDFEASESFFEEQGGKMEELLLR